MRISPLLFSFSHPQSRGGFIILMLLLCAVTFALPVHAQQQGCTISTATVQPSQGSVISHNDSLTLEISISSGDPNCTHTGTGWEVASDPSFALNSLIYSTPFSSVVDLTSTNIGGGTFQPGTQYWWAATIQTEQFGSFINYLIEGTFSTAQVGGPCTQNSLPTPWNDSPQDGSTVANTTPTLGIASLIPNCDLVGSWWEISEDPNFQIGNTSFTRETSFGEHLYELPVPPNFLEAGKTYFWRVQFFAKNGAQFEYGPYSQPTAFNVQAAGGSGGPCAPNQIPDPWNFEPQDGDSVSMTPTLGIASLVPNCDLDGSWWEFSKDPNFSIVEFFFNQEAVLGDDLYQLTIPGGMLDPNTTYYWRVAFYVNLPNQQRAFSAESTPTSFRTQGQGGQLPGNCTVPTPGLMSPVVNATNVSLTPTLKVDNASNPGACVDGSIWWLNHDPTFPNNSNISYDGDIAMGRDPLSWNVPAGTLQPNTTYYWIVWFYEATTPTTFGTESQTGQFTTGSGGNQQPGPSNCNSLPIPTITSPSDGAANQPLTPTLQVNYSANPGSCVDGSVWWLSDDPTFANLIDSYDADTALGRSPLSWTVPVGTLQANKTYYWVVWFYEDTTPTSFSSESQVVRFTTGTGGSGGTTPPGGGGTTPPGGGSSTLTIPQAVARLVQSDPNRADADQVIGDREIIDAITLWIFGNSVPNTSNQTIGDNMMIDLIKTWIGGMPVTTQGAIPVSTAYAMAELERLAASITSGQITSTSTSLAINAVRLQASGYDRWTLSINGSGIAGANVQVFDTSGRLLINQSTDGQSLTLLAQDNGGHRLANGVYLYMITVHDSAGNAVRSDIGKWMVLR